MLKLILLKFCIVFPWQRYIPAWTHDVISHSSVAKEQHSILCMVLYIAYSDAGQFIARMCQISPVYISLRKRYESTLSYFWLTLVYNYYIDFFKLNNVSNMSKVFIIQRYNSSAHFSFLNLMVKRSNTFTCILSSMRLINYIKLNRFTTGFTTIHHMSQVY